MTVHAPLTVPLTDQVAAQLAGLSIKELGERLRIVLPDRTVSELRENYLDQVHRHTNSPGIGVDRDWLRADQQGLYFVTQAGDRLNLVLTPTAAAEKKKGERTVLIVDQSGSMNRINDAVFAGAREVVENLPVEAEVRLITFNETVRVGPLTSRDEANSNLDTRLASGPTALRDAIVMAMAAEEEDAVEIVTFVVLTDGEDNASSATVEDVRQAIERANARGWRFLFLGANQDAIAAAATYGIARERALTFGTANAPQAFRAVSENVARFRSMGTDTFTELDRADSVQ
jgi:hypothetical protein